MSSLAYASVRARARRIDADALQATKLNAPLLGPAGARAGLRASPGHQPVLVTACTLARQMMWAKMPRSAARHLCNAAARLAPALPLFITLSSSLAHGVLV
jgi:hypothetical protein